MRGLYKVLKNLISIEDAQILAEIIRSEPGGENEDTQVLNSKSHYGISACNTLLGLLCDTVSRAAGKKLRPTYTYCRVYRKGNILTPHKDRPSCEYSVTLNLAQTHRWDIYMGKRAVNLSVGDGVLYKGCDIEHSRKEFTGDEYIQVFLHYVDADGPYKNYIHDRGTKTARDLTMSSFQYVFARQNKHLLRFVYVKDFLTSQECQQIIDSRFMLEKAVTEGGLTDIRRSEIFWIPKIERWAPLYEKIMHAVGTMNREAFDFDITSIHEHLQFTEYDESYQGHYGWHFDVGENPVMCNRKLSISIQLSDPSDYDGGELQFQFDNDNVTIAEKARGTLVLFPSYLRHRVTPVTRGVRRSLVLWITGPPFR